MMVPSLMKLSKTRSSAIQPTEVRMCGRARYSTRASAKIREVVGGSPAGPVGAEVGAGAPADRVGAPADPIDRHVENLSPGGTIPVVVASGSGSCAVELMKWGLIPQYASDPKPDHYKLFNKRIESFSKAGSGKYFDQLASRQRCVVVLDGFFEWKGRPGDKQPYYVQCTEQPLVLAAIFEDNGSFKSFSILTGEPSPRFREIHDRQPVLLTADQVRRWLDCSCAAGTVLAEIERNHEEDQGLVFHPVTKRMTRAQYQETDCTTPIKLASDALRSFLTPAPKSEPKPAHAPNDSQHVESRPGHKRKGGDEVRGERKEEKRRA